MFLIDDLLIWLARQIGELVEKELYDEGRIKERLMELQLKFELGEISEDDYNQQEEELIAYLGTIRKAKGGV